MAFYATLGSLHEEAQVQPVVQPSNTIDVYGLRKDDEAAFTGRIAEFLRSQSPGTTSAARRQAKRALVKDFIERIQWLGEPPVLRLKFSDGKGIISNTTLISIPIRVQIIYKFLIFKNIVLVRFRCSEARSRP